MNERMKDETQQPKPPLAHRTSQLPPAGLPHSVDPMRVPDSAGSISPPGTQASQAQWCLFGRQGLALTAQLPGPAARPAQSHSGHGLRSPEDMWFGGVENAWPWSLG